MQYKGNFKKGYNSILESELLPTDKIILIYLIHFTKNSKSVYPSIKGISDNLKISDRSVRYCISKLKDLGLLEVIRRTDDKGKDISNEYRIIKEGVNNYFNDCIFEIDKKVKPVIPNEKTETDNQFKTVTPILPSK